MRCFALILAKSKIADMTTETMTKTTPTARNMLDTSSSLLLVSTYAIVVQTTLGSTLFAFTSALDAAAPWGASTDPEIDPVEILWATATALRISRRQKTPDTTVDLRSLVFILFSPFWLVKMTTGRV